MQDARVQKDRAISEALQLVLTCNVQSLLSVASQDTLSLLKKRLSSLAQSLELKSVEGSQPVLDEKVIKGDLLPATLWNHIFFTFLDPYAHVAISRTCLEFRQLIYKNEMMLLNNFMSRSFIPIGPAFNRPPSGNKSPTSSPPTSPCISPKGTDVSPPPLQRVLSPSSFSLANPPELDNLKTLTACVRLRPTVLRVTMLPFQFIEAVINFTNVALRQISGHHEGDDDEAPSQAQTEALFVPVLASFDLLLALLWRPRFAETNQDLYTKIFTHILSHMTTLHDLVEPGWQLVLASFSSHDKYDKAFVHSLLRPYLNPFRHYSTFSLLAVADLRCLLQMMPKMFSPTLADKLFEHLVRLHGLLGGISGTQTDSRAEEIVPLIQGVIGLFPFISGGQRLKPQIDQVAASLAIYQQQQNKNGGPDKKRKDSQTKRALLRKQSLLSSQGTRTYPTPAKAPRGTSNVIESRPKFDRVKSGGRDDELTTRPAITRMGSHEVKERGVPKPPPEAEAKGAVVVRKGSGDSDKVLSGSESDEPGCRLCGCRSSDKQSRHGKTKPAASKDFTDKLFTAAKSGNSKYSGLSITPDLGFEAASETPFLRRDRSASFGPAERRRLSKDRKTAMGLDDAEDEGEDEDEDAQQQLKQKMIQQELHRQLQQQLQSQQFEQLQRQQMQFLQQMQAQQMQALANMQRQQNQFFQAQFESKNGETPPTNGNSLTAPSSTLTSFTSPLGPPSPGGNTNTYMPADRSSPPSRPQSPPAVPPSLSCPSNQATPWSSSSAATSSVASSPFISSCSCPSMSSFASMSSFPGAHSSSPFPSSSSSSSSSHSSTGFPSIASTSGPFSASQFPPALSRRPPPPPSGNMIPAMSRDVSPGGLPNGGVGDRNVVCRVCTKSTPAQSAACVYCGTHLIVHVAAPIWRHSLESQFSAAFPHSADAATQPPPQLRSQTMPPGGSQQNPR